MSHQGLSPDVVQWTSTTQLRIIVEWIEETEHPRKAEAMRVMAHQLDEVVGELGTL
ncbi:MAG: hypothetical protein GY762_15300 [Proteobacteria bacterium]|nr:hypothetical protein [Pseudomonadota bacterium]